MQYAMLWGETNLLRKNGCKKVPFLDVKFKIGDFISDLKVISCFLYSFLLFPFFLRRLVQLEHLDKRKQLINIQLVISDSIQHVYVMEISFLVSVPVIGMTGW